jgi:hypothetical protein
MHDFLLNQNFLKSFIGPLQPISLNIIPNLPSSIQPMSPSLSHITPINSTTSLINSNNFPSPNNHVLNPNPSIIEFFSKLSNNDDQNEVMSPKRKGKYFPHFVNPQ